jgi:fatty acid desaturase
MRVAGPAMELVRGIALALAPSLPRRSPRAAAPRASHPRRWRLAPTRSEAIAVSILALWLLTFHHALFRHALNPLTWPLLYAPLALLVTAAFITAHDAMHGSASL